MRKCMNGALLSAVLMIAMVGRASADDEFHQYEHDRLDAEHGRGHWVLQDRHETEHAALDAEHRAAHAANPWMTRKQHRRLHKQLEREHAWGDSQLYSQHEQLHRALDNEHDAYHAYHDDYWR